MLEREVKTYFLAQCKARDWVTRKVRWEGRRGATDWLLLAPNGLIWWVELKAAGKHPDNSQQEEHRLFRQFGQKVVVLDSKTSIDELICLVEMTLDRIRP